MGQQNVGDQSCTGFWLLQLIVPKEEGLGLTPDGQASLSSLWSLPHGILQGRLGPQERA